METPVERSTRQLRKTRKKLREISRLRGKGRSQLDVQQQQKLDRGAEYEAQARRLEAELAAALGGSSSAVDAEVAAINLGKHRGDAAAGSSSGSSLGGSRASSRASSVSLAHTVGRERHRDDRKLVAMPPTRTSTGQIALYMHSRVYRKVGEAVMITSEKK